ncbi:hypothetical protein PR370_01075 [Mycobacterium marinum]|uniref:hypothetical protein n=1 Tax=Mycobacterium marinum TaxID=1781 RepID=UPI002359D41E|nr:hypothetical protein [Mycobacterium marinum]MDC8980674.1 hypothetical protein [Mycobacterium marinum]MDC8997900.1 hypothetical protein [Mycobacterium marinum]MDC9008640.1 hypothetical protein [Mycobacterium marinum]
MTAQEEHSSLSTIPLPPGATWADQWDDVGRVVTGPHRHVTDSDVRIWTSALQRTDGAINNQRDYWPPQVHVEGNVIDVNSDQARELAAALLEAAALIDGWVAR